MKIDNIDIQATIAKAQTAIRKLFGIKSTTLCVCGAQSETDRKQLLGQTHY